MTANSELTPAEANVHRLIATGLLNKQIASELGVGEQMVKVHVGRILAKIGASNRTQAALAWHGIAWRRA